MPNEFRVRKGLVVNGSGSVILDVQGSQGQLFSVTDQLSGSLFAVSDASGIPVLEAFSDTTVKLGLYGAEAIIVSGSNARMTGSLFGTASWASNAITASNALTSSFVLNAVSASFAATASSVNPLVQNVQITGSLNLSGSQTIALIPTASSVRGTLSMGGGPFNGTTSGFFAGTGSGTTLAINETGSFSGDLISAQVAGSSRFRLSSAGIVTMVGVGPNNGNPNSNGSITFYNGANSSQATILASNANELTTTNPWSRNGVGDFTIRTNTGTILMVSRNATDVSLTTRGASGQTADLLQLQNSSGLVQSHFDATGSLLLGTPSASNGAGILQAQGNIVPAVSQSNFTLGTSIYPWAGLVVSGSAIITGSLTAPNITGSLLGTASWALNVISSSFAATASSADNFVIRQNATASNLLVNNTITAQTLVVQTITSSVDFVTGSTRFGSLLTDTHQFTGSVSVTGSLSLNDSPVITAATFTPTSSSISTRVTNLESTASVLTSASASFAQQSGSNSTRLTNLESTASVLTTASASFALVSASYSAFSQSYNTGSFTGSFTGVGNLTGSLFGTSSWSLNAITASNALTASFVPTSSLTGNFFSQGGNSFGAQALLGTNDNQDLAFETSGSTRMFISSSGLVGINVINPTAQLDISGSARVRSTLTINYGTTNRTTQLRENGLFISRTSDGGYASTITADGSMTYNTRNSHIFQNDSTTTMTLTDNTRNVLIGTTSDAGFKLDVNGTARINGNTQITGSLNVNGSSARIGYSYGGTIFANGSWGYAKVGTGGEPTIAMVSNVQATTQTLEGVTIPATGSALVFSSVYGYNVGNDYQIISVGKLGVRVNNTTQVFTIPTSGIVTVNQGLIVSGSTTLVGSLTVRGNQIITGSSTATEGYTGSLFGTASWALNAITASNATTASFVLNAVSASFAATASSADDFLIRQNATASNLLVSNTITAQTLVVQTITSSVDFVTGSTRFGTLLTNTHQFTGSVSVTGSLSVNDSPVVTNSTFTPFSSSVSTRVTNLESTASVLTTASASFALVSSSYAAFSQSYNTGSFTGSFTGTLIGTASWANNAVTASFVANAVSASFAATASSVNSLVQNVQITGSLNVNGNINITNPNRLYLTTDSSTWAYSPGSNQLNLGINASANSVIKISNGNIQLGSNSTGQGMNVLDGGYTAINAAGSSSRMLRIESAGSQVHLVLSRVVGNFLEARSSDLATLYTAITSTGGALFSGSVAIGKMSTTSQLDILGNTIITGSLTTSGSFTLIGNQTITGSSTATGGYTGSLFGTSSWAQNVISSSYAATASILLGSVVSASFASTASSVNTLVQPVLISGSFTVFTGSAVEFQVTNTGVKIGNVGLDIHTITGSIYQSGSTVAASLRGSGSAVFSVDGTSGRLFQVDDSLSGSLFSVNTAAGLPIIEAFSDNTVRIAQFGQRAFFVSQSVVGIGKESLLNGKLDVSGSTFITGSLSVSQGITGSLFGTSSWAQNVISASFAGTASVLLGSVVSASFATTASFAQTASFVVNTVSASFAATASSVNPLVQNVLVTGSLFVSSSNQTQLQVGSNILFVSSSGNVGIGTTTPSYRLDIVGINNVISRIRSTTNTGASAYLAENDVNSTYEMGMWGSTRTPFGSIDSDNAYLYGGKPLAITSLVAIKFGTGLSVAERMRIDVNGNVGIGSTSPSYLLDVAGTLRTTGNTFLATAGNVGIGTTSAPGYTGYTGLVINNATNGGLIDLHRAGTRVATFYNTATTVEFGAIANVPLIIYTNTIERMRIAANGSVGIGTTSPSFLLDVSGSLRTVGNVQTTGSLNVSSGITGSLFGTSSWAQNVISSSFAQNTVSASFAATASSADNFFIRQNATASNLLVSNTITAQTLVVQTITSSIDFVTGSTRFGSLLTNTHQFTGSVTITGSLSLNDSPVVTNATFTPFSSSVSTRITNLESTASVLTTASASFAIVSSSFATTSGSLSTRVTTLENASASFAQQSGSNSTRLANLETTASVLTTASASFALVSSSYAALSGSFRSGSFTGSFTGALIGTASWAQNVVSASFASTASSVNTLNQNVIITGSLTVGSGSIGSGENTLILGPAPSGGTGEGGQILLSAVGGVHTSASMLDNYQNRMRVLRGTNAGSDAEVASFNMHNRQLTLHAYNSPTAFAGTSVANLSVDSSGNVITTATGTVTSASFASTASFVNPLSQTVILTGSLNTTGSVFLRGLTTSSQANVVSYDVATGQLYYQAVAGGGGSSVTASYALTASAATDFTIRNTLTLDRSLMDYATVASSVVGSNNLFTQATGSYSSAFFKYTAANGANARSGEVMAVWNAASVQFTDNSTLDIGSTTPVTCSVSVVGTDVQFNVQTNTSGWTIKSVATYM